MFDHHQAGDDTDHQHAGDDDDHQHAGDGGDHHHAGGYGDDHLDHRGAALLLVLQRVLHFGEVEILTSAPLEDIQHVLGEEEEEERSSEEEWGE